MDSIILPQQAACHTCINFKKYIYPRNQGMTAAISCQIDTSVSEFERRREGSVLSYSVVVRAVHISGHAEVSDLDQQVLPHQTVPGGQVPVDKVLGGQVDHAGCDLLGDVQHLRLGQLHLDAVLAVGHQDRVRAMRPASVVGQE